MLTYYIKTLPLYLKGKYYANRSRKCFDKALDRIVTFEFDSAEYYQRKANEYMHKYSEVTIELARMAR